MSLFLFVSRSLSLFLYFSLDFNFAGAQESALFLFIFVPTVSTREPGRQRNGLALRITRNCESANTDEVRCWGESWGVWLSADDLWRFFSPHGASGQQRRGLQSKTLPQKRPALWTHNEHYGHGDGHRGSGRDRSEGRQQWRRDSNWDSHAPRPVWQ